MIHITIEVNGYHQLIRAEKHLIEGLAADIEQLFKNTGFQKSDSKPGFFMYECEDENMSLSRLVDILFYLHVMIRERSEEIPGMTAFVQKSGLLKRSRPEVDYLGGIYLLPEADGVWCSRGTLDLISHFVECREEGGYYLISEFHRDSLSSRKTPELFRSGDILDQLLDHIFAMINEKERRIPVLVGPAGTGKRLLIRKLFDMIQTKGEKPEWLQIHQHHDIGPSCISLLHEVRPGMFSEHTHLKNESEQSLWQDMEKLLSIPYKSWSETDAVICFMNYLEAYCMDMASNLLPAVFVAHGFDEMDENLHDFIIRMIENDAGSRRLVPLLTMRQWDGTSGISPGLQFRPFYMKKWIEQISPDGQTALSSPYQLYFPAEKKNAVDVLMGSIEQIQSVYYICSRLDGLLAKGMLQEVFKQIGIGRDESEQCLYQLVSFGLLSDTERCFPVSAGTVRTMMKSIQIDYGRLNRAMETIILNHLDALEYQHLVIIANMIGFSDESWTKIYRLLAENILSDWEVPYLPHVEKAFDLLDHRIPSIESVLLLLACMLDGNLAAAEHYYNRLFQEDVAAVAEGQTGRWIEVLTIYAEGEYLWRKRGEKEKVLRKVKQALLQVQDLSFPELEDRALILLGKVMLTHNRNTEAAEYFRQARQMTFDTDLHSIACESIALTALTYFLTGDYSLSYSHALASEQKAHDTGRRLWEQYAMMLRARIQFELGRYQEASVLFQQLLAHDRLFFAGDRHDYFMGWLARTAVYQGYTANALGILVSLPETCETLFFQAEAHLLNRNLETANLFATSALIRLEDEESNILPIFRLPSDGFEPFENLSLKIPGVYNTIRQILFGISGFCLHELGQTEEAEEAFETLFSQEKITRQDPYRHLYYYFRTVTLPSSADAEELNMLTYLSKAFQSLQKIAGRISDPSDRRSYTTQNYWNSKLFTLSRHYKLV